MVGKSPERDILIIFKHIVHDLQHPALKLCAGIQELHRVPEVLHAVNQDGLQQQGHDLVVIAGFLRLLFIDGEQHIAHERIVTAVEADRDGKKRQIGNMKRPKGIHANLRGQTQAVGGGNQFVTGERIDDGEAACALLKRLSLYSMGTGAGKDKDKLHKVMPMSRDMHIAKQLFHFDIAICPYEVLCTQAGLPVLGRIILLQLPAFCLKGGASDIIQRREPRF